MSHKEPKPAPALRPDAVVLKLSRDLASGDVRLPSLPDIALRVQKVLDDPRASREQVAKVVSADAALAARIMKLANSAFLNPSAKPITDLQRALTQVGHQLVRCTAVSFSVQQMQLGSGDAALRPYMRELWRKGASIASIAYVLARHSGAAKPDVALMCGLMHNIGELYFIISDPRRFTEYANNEAWRDMVRKWHPRIAGLILKHWKFPEDINTAIAQQNMPDNERNADGLTDVLVAARALEVCVLQRELLDNTVTEGLAFQRLHLSTEDCKQLFTEVAEQIKALRAALSGG